MQLSVNLKIFAQFFSPFPQSAKIFEYFEEKEKRQRWFVSEIIDCKKPGYLNA